LNLALFLPEIALLVTAVAVILTDLFVREKRILTWLSVLGIIVSGVFTALMWNEGSRTIFGNHMVVDNFALFFKVLFLGVGLFVILFSTDYLHKLPDLHGEYHALILLATLGAVLLSAATELMTLYVAMEVMSLSLYALSGFGKDAKSSEAALKYILLSSISSAILLYGMAMVFGFTGSTNLGAIAASIQSNLGSSLLENPALLMGIVMMIAGFGFKIAAVPFQLWVPDVYEGAPTPVTAFLSVASKAAGFALILRVFFTAFQSPAILGQNWGMIFAVLAAIGMVVGNISALRQTNVKRLLGYSSIAQAGYLLVGLAVLGIAPATAVVARSGILFFLFSYALTNIGAFAAITVISNKINSDTIDDFKGMGKRAPVLALCLTVSLISLIGMPPAAGFMAKFYLFNGAVQYGLLWLVIIAVINSVISAFYYLRIVRVMWFSEPGDLEKVPSSGATRFTLLACSLGVLFVGVAPGLVMKLAEWAALMF
jgi:NADH-quinone oxidoreductase subunit N